MNKIILIFLVFAASLSRLAPHPPNFTPILSIALFTGLIFKNKIGFVIPLLIMVISDYFIGSFSMALWVYVPILLIYFVGNIFNNTFNYKNVLIMSFISSLIFFIVSNFGVWLLGYPKNITGLISCYIAAIPFFKNTIFSTILYSSFLYYGYEFLINRYTPYQES